MKTNQEQKCGGKNCYSYSVAHYIINNAHKPNYGAIKRKKIVPKRAYFCIKCRCWHLTKKIKIPKEI